MKKYILVFFIMLLWGGAVAQNSGFMGRRVLVGVEGSFNIASFWRQAFTSSPLSEYKSIAQALPHVEVITHNKGVVGLFYGYDPRSSTGLSSQNEVSTYQISSDIHRLDLYYKQYVGHTRAPLGSFVRFRYTNYIYNYQVDPSIRFTDGTQSKGTNYLGALHVEFGYDYFLANLVQLSWQVSVGSAFGGYKAFFDDDLAPNNYVNRDLLWDSFIGMSLGISFLAF